MEIRSNKGTFFGKSGDGGFKKRIRIVSLLIIAVFGILLVRIWQLQFIQGERFRNLSENNRIRLKRIEGLRGLIFDRRKRLLVTNRPSFFLTLIPEDAYDIERVIERLSFLTELSAGVVYRKLAENLDNAPFQPIVLKEDLLWDEVARLEANKLDLPGINVEIGLRRNYLYSGLAAHLVGYLGKISQKQLAQRRFQGYAPSAYVGKYGLEERYESELRGIEGGQQIEVNAIGRELKVLGEVSPQAGNNLVLTIDFEIQKIAEEALGDRPGAVVVGNARGDILALVSHPSFDPNDFSSGISEEDWEGLLMNPYHPLQDRTTTGQYPPGSTFKIITAAAGLEEGLIRPETVLFCPGYYVLGNRRYRCWKKSGHGWLNIHNALVQSCDVFFYQLGLKVGIDRLAEYARRFGLGSKTRINLNHERAGLIPTTGWKLRRFQEPWQKGETLLSAIGQSYTLVTPIQQFVMMSALVNGDSLYVPRIVDRIESPDGSVLKRFPRIKKESLRISADSLRLIRDALVAAVEDPKGTGWRARIKGITIGGKTGTAQVVQLDADRDGSIDQEDIPFKFRDHAWFVSFADVKGSKFIVIVLVEHGGYGGKAAAPIAKRIFKGIAEIYQAERA